MSSSSSTGISLEATAASAIGWAFVAVGIVLTGIRYALRGWIIRSFYWDDLFHALTLLLFIGQLAAFQVYIRATSVAMQPSNHEPIDQRYWTLQQTNVAVTIMGLTLFWTTKAAFLMLYRLLFKTRPGFRLAWWIVVAYTFLSYWAVIGGTLAECGGLASNILRTSVCNNPANLPYQKQRFIFNYVLNITSDLAAIILPIVFLSGLQLSFRRKLGLSLIFSFGLIIMAFETLRFVNSVKGNATSNNSLWGFIEAAACVYVSCMPTFASLRVWKRNGYRSTNPHSGYPLRERQAHQGTSANQSSIGRNINESQPSLPHSQTSRSEFEGKTANTRADEV